MEINFKNYDNFFFYYSCGKTKWVSFSATKETDIGSKDKRFKLD